TVRHVEETTIFASVRKQRSCTRRQAAVSRWSRPHLTLFVTCSTRKSWWFRTPSQSRKSMRCPMQELRSREEETDDGRCGRPPSLDARSDEECRHARHPGEFCQPALRPEERRHDER